MNARTLALAAILTSLASPTAVAGHPFYCGSYRVRAGQHVAEVLDRCGEPDYASQRVDRRTYRVTRRPFGHHGEEVTEERTIEVLVDEWIYDFGPNQYLRRLRFENGFLAGVDSRWVGSW